MVSSGAKEFDFDIGLPSTCGVLVGEPDLDFERVKQDLNLSSCFERRCSMGWPFAVGMCRIRTIDDCLPKTGVLIVFSYGQEESEKFYLALCCSDYKQPSVVVKLRIDQFFYVDVKGRFVFVKTEETVHVVEFPKKWVACEFFQALSEKCKFSAEPAPRQHQYSEEEFISTEESDLQYFEISNYDPEERTTCCELEKKIWNFLKRTEDFNSVETHCDSKYAEQLATSYANGLSILRRRLDELSSYLGRDHKHEKLNDDLYKRQTSTSDLKLKLKEIRILNNRLKEVHKKRERFDEFVRMQRGINQKSMEDTYNIYSELDGLKPCCDPNGYRTKGLAKEEENAVNALVQDIDNFSSQLRDKMRNIAKDEATKFFEDQVKVLNGIEGKLLQVMEGEGTKEDLQAVKSHLKHLEQLYNDKFTEQYYTFSPLVAGELDSLFRKPAAFALKKLNNLCREAEMALHERNLKKKHQVLQSTNKTSQEVATGIARLNLNDPNEMKAENRFEVAKGQRVLPSAANKAMVVKEFSNGLTGKELNEFVRLVDEVSQHHCAIRIRGYIFSDQKSLENGTSPTGILINGGYVSLQSVVMDHGQNGSFCQAVDISTSLRWIKDIVVFSKFAMSKGYSVDGITLKDVGISSKNEAHIWEFEYCKAFPKEDTEKQIVVQRSVRCICIMAWEVLHRKPFTLTAVSDPNLLPPEIAEIFTKKFDEGRDVSLDEVLKAVEKVS